MAKKYNYLEFYERCMKTGRLPSGSGLCDEVKRSSWDKDNIDGELLNLFRPTSDDREWIGWDGHDQLFWASGLPADHPDEVGTFTPLRQTIVLFMAAINREL